MLIVIKYDKFGEITELRGKNIMDSHLWEMLGIGATIIGANYLFVKDVRTDLKEHISKVEDDLKEQLTDFKNRMETIDMRWASLFEKFHILDKDMEKFRIQHKVQ